MISLFTNVVPVKAQGFIVVDVLCAGDEEFMSDPNNVGRAEQGIADANSRPYMVDCFEDTFNLHFAVRGWKTWDSDDDTHDPRLMAYEVWTETGFETGMEYDGYTIEMLCAFTGQDIEGYYAVTFPDANITLIEAGSVSTVAKADWIIRHEFSWQFHCPDGCTNYCVMNSILAYFGHYFADWCPTCRDWINTHKYKWSLPQLSISASSGGTTYPAPGTYTYSYGSSVTVTAQGYSRYIFDYWILDGATKYGNEITVTMDSDHDLTAYFEYIGYVGGCPTLFVWDGSGYVDYGVIDIHNPTGEDVVREVPVQAEDVGISNYKATFRLREGWEGLNFSESVIDQVKLYAINEDGKLKLCPLLSATHSRLGDVREYVVSSDDVKVQTLLLETIDLTFKVREDFQGFVFVIEGCNLSKV